MAIGSARLLGLNIMENFDSPYLSSSVKMFWRRWHISLTSWFKDYLYIPLGGSRCSKLRNVLNTLIVFAVSGLWHGASVTFLIWGVINGIYLVIGNLMSPVYRKIKDYLKIKDSNNLFLIIKGTITFILISLTWIFFRADNLEHAILIFKSIYINKQLAISLTSLEIDAYNLIVLIVSIIVMLVIDVLTRKKYLPDMLNNNLILTYVTCFLLIIAIILFGVYGAGYDPLEFVYFKF